jgi:hypothetical protein
MFGERSPRSRGARELAPRREFRLVELLTVWIARARGTRSGVPLLEFTETFRSTQLGTSVAEE